MARPARHHFESERVVIMGGFLWIVIIGYVLGRLQEGFFIWQFKFELHAWRPGARA